MEKASKILLNDYWVNVLLKAPETGMGYHLVDIELKNGDILRKKTIVNSTFVQLNQDEKLNLEDIKKIRMCQQN